MLTKKVKNENGEYVTVKVKPSEVKQTIMKAHGWNDETYRKQYDLFKNKLRAYESFVNASDPKGTKKKQSPIEILYKQAKAMQRAKESGETYEPSFEMKRIESFSALSITKGRQAVKSESYMQRYGKKYTSYTLKQFEGYLKANASARQMVEELKAKGATPAQIERALTDHANKHWVSRKANGEVEGGSVAIQAGETIGSTDTVDYYIEDYLE